MTKPAGADSVPGSDALPGDRVTPSVGAGDATARRTWQLLSEVGLSLRATWTGLAAEFDLTPMQALALKRLEPDTPLPMNTLADVMICDASNVTGIVDKLEARGLIERRPLEHDRRVKMLAVTKRGEELRRRFMERSSEPPPTILKLSSDDQRLLSEVLERLLATEPTR
jgi:DNA-binding MarR family transcriptional regulator